MSSKSQTSIFLILAIVLLLAFAAVFMVSNKGGEPNTHEISDTKTTQEALNFFMGSCLELVSNDAMVYYGIDEDISTDWLIDYISKNVVACTKGFEAFREEGFEVEEEDITVKVDINDVTIDVDLEYPIEMTKSPATITFKEQNYVVPRKLYEPIKAGDETLITSHDNRFQIIVPPGTTMTGGDRPGIELLDREFE